MLSLRRAILALLAIRETLRNGYAPFARELRDHAAPAMRHEASALPFVDCASAQGDVGGRRYCLCQTSGVAQGLAKVVDQPRMVHEGARYHRFCEFASPLSITEASRALLPVPRKNLGMAAKEHIEPDSPDKVIVGRRLRITRESLPTEDQAPTQRELADLLGVHYATYSNWENGIALVPPWFVQKLKRLFGVTHDWIYGGDLSGLRADLRTRILPKLERLGVTE